VIAIELIRFAEFQNFNLRKFGLMNRIYFIGDFVKEMFILPSHLGRAKWTEKTKFIERQGLVFLTRDLTNCLKTETFEIEDTYLPCDITNRTKIISPPPITNHKFYSQIFELDPESRLVVRLLQRSILDGEDSWSIDGQLNIFKNLYSKSKDNIDVLFVEQEELTDQSREDEIQNLFEQVKNCQIERLFIKTNKPKSVLKEARKRKYPDSFKPTIMLTTLRALNAEKLRTHTWDEAVRHVLRELGKIPKWLKIGVELWNEGCLWMDGKERSLFWDKEVPLGAQRFRGKGWTTGSTNVTCAYLLSQIGEKNWPDHIHVKDSWVLSRQCSLIDKNHDDEILNLPMSFKKLLKMEENARPRAFAFGETTFSNPVDENWSFLDGLSVDDDLIYNVVHKGQKVLPAHQCPFLRIGKLVEFEEEKIEALLKLNYLLRDYASRHIALRPLSIAVFGPSGAGKSFTVKQVVQRADLSLEPVFFSYNLSQLREVDDIIPAFHAVQSAVLRGTLPIVFWDEFDAKLESQELGWLKYFLGPMQDGEFFVRGAFHPLGRSVFVFAGATAMTFADFASRKDQASMDAKVPDFVSRIKASLNVSALPSLDNSSGNLLRALLVHELLNQHAPQVSSVDKDVIKLLISDSFQTSRELERVVEAAALGDTNRFSQDRILFKGS
jgi:hypothetical protein